MHTSCNKTEFISFVESVSRMVDSMASRSATLRVAEFDSIVFGMISLLSWANSFCVRSFNVCEDSIFCVKGFGAYVGFGSGAFGEGSCFM